MTSTTKLLVVGLALVAAALGAVALAVTLTRGDSTVTIAGPGVVTTPNLDPGYVGAPGSVQAEKPTVAELDNVRDQVMTWLVVNGFQDYSVSGVTAFSNSDYVAIQSSTGDDAFELLAAPQAGWLMLEPTSMMWNTRYGMSKSFETNWSGTGRMALLMGGGRTKADWRSWFTVGQAKVGSEQEAVTVANRWLAKSRPAERAASKARAYPGYYSVDTLVDGKKAGMLSVNADTGAVWYHGWHGGFLVERSYR
jgi:hypothetical protein